MNNRIYPQSALNKPVKEYNERLSLKTKMDRREKTIDRILNMDKIKQVIVIRKDLKMRKGKMVSQGAHASFGVFLDMMEHTKLKNGDYGFKFTCNSVMSSWLLKGEFTKITVSVDSEKELEEVFNSAKLLKLPTKIITDLGYTEFDGVPTKTACVIGPCLSSDVDQITGNLSLL